MVKFNPVNSIPQHIADRLNPPAKAEARQRNEGYHGRAGFAYIHEVHAAGLVPDRQQWQNGICLGRAIDPYAVALHGTGLDKWQGQIDPSRPPLSYSNENNLVTIAPSGSGKGTTGVIPTLLSCTESMFVLDVKGENFFISLPARAAMGHTVRRIDPFDIFGDADQLGNALPPGDQFNPLGHLRPDQKDFEEKIESLAAAIIVHEGTGDPHWTDRARQLVSCLMAFLCSDPEERAAGHNNLPYLREILGWDESKFAAYMQVAYETATVDLVSNNAARFAATGNKEIGSVVSTALGQLGFLNHKGIRRFLSASTFNFEDLRRQPVTVFCMLPPNMLDTYYRFARLMVQSFFNSMSRTPKATDRRVLALLDEQAKLRHMDVIETSAALLRGYRVRIWSIFQDITQIKSIYGEAWETFISNAGVIQLMTPNGATTAQYFSDRVGPETITETKNTVSAPNVPLHMANPASGTSTYEHSYPVPFLSPQDLYAMPRDTALLLVQGMSWPVLTAREAYYHQTTERLTFYGTPYAPHPVHDANAFDWMKRYLAANPLP